MMFVDNGEAEDAVDVEVDAISNDQGYHEVEVSTGEYSDLHDRLIDCQKNSGHANFIPASRFCENDLPSQYREDANLMDLLRSLINLTVRISVSHISKDRPQFVPGTKTTFPFYHFRGRSNISRTGTGQVIKVDKYADRNCPCHNCQQSKEPFRLWGRVVIATAAHVVCDGDEGEHTRCHFFYDNTETKFHECTSLAGTWRVDTDIALDHCVMKFLTHDMDLVEKLDKHVRRYMSLCTTVWDSYKPRLDPMDQMEQLEKLCEWCRRLADHWSVVLEKYSEDKAGKEDDDHFIYLRDQFKYWCGRLDSAIKQRDDYKSGHFESPETGENGNAQDALPSLTVVVSHPHGCSKMVTVGKVTERTEEKDTEDVAVSKYFYTSQTCKGSSGAPVFILGRSWRAGCDHPHSGSYAVKDGSDQVNQSAGGRDY